MCLTSAHHIPQRFNIHKLQIFNNIDITNGNETNYNPTIPPSYADFMVASSQGRLLLSPSDFGYISLSGLTLHALPDRLTGPLYPPPWKKLVYFVVYGTVSENCQAASLPRGCFPPLLATPSARKHCVSIIPHIFRVILLCGANDVGRFRSLSRFELLRRISNTFITLPHISAIIRLFPRRDIQPASYRLMDEVNIQSGRSHQRETVLSLFSLCYWCLSPPYTFAIAFLGRASLQPFTYLPALRNRYYMSSSLPMQT
jgi:hypothetical protein